MKIKIIIIKYYFSADCYSHSQQIETGSDRFPCYMCIRFFHGYTSAKRFW